MSKTRAQVDFGANNVRAAGPGDATMDQDQVVGIATVGSGLWTAVAIMAGIIDRTGPTAGYADTPDTAANILAACPQLGVGDSFRFNVRNTVAFANTVAVNTGVELSGADTAIAASLVREYLLTCMSNKASQILSVGTTNASAVLTGMTQAQVDSLQPGMGVTGTGIPASTTIIAINSSNGTVTMSANATATATVAGTFFPRFLLKGIRSSTL